MNRVGKIGAKSLYLLGITVLVFTSFFFILSEKAKAADIDHLVINEIYPHSNSGENEWIEIYNPKETVMNLTTYTIEDGTHIPKTLGDKNIFPGKYLILVKSIDFNFTMNDSGDELILKDLAVIIDSVMYGNWDDNKMLNNAVKPNLGETISRIPNGTDTDNDINDFQIVPVTKSAENVLPPPIVYSDEIIINEIVPQPKDGVINEFIELFNNGEVTVDLSGWFLDDSDGGSSPYSIPSGIIMAPKQYYTFCKTGSLLLCDNYGMNISLNDTGDSARLIDPNGEVKCAVVYDKTERGMSYSLFETNYKWTKVLTSNAVNIYEVDTYDALNIQLITIAQAKTLKDGDKISISGYVTALPGVLSSQYIYIQDDTGGIQIYLYDKDFPLFVLGQKIQANGELSTISGERRLKLASAVDMSILEDKKVIEPLELSVMAITEQHIGELVTTKGVVTRTSGDTFYISDGTKEIKVIIRDGTNIDKPKMRQGDTFIVTGVLSTYGGELRILPIDQNDVTLLSSGALPKAGPKNIYHFLFIIFYFATWILFLIQKRRLGNLPVTTLTS